MKKLDINQAEPIRKKFCPSWEIRKGTYLYKKVALDDYNQVLRFLMMIEQPQIKLDHFADFMNFYNELTIAITTHDVKGLTQLDFELALWIDEALKQMDARQIDENYTRDQLPQIKNKQLSKLKHTIETVALKDIIPVQKERIMENFKRQVDNIVAGKYKPIIVDKNNKIVNGHHRYTALEMLGYENVEVARLPWSLKTILENFADGKKKGKSRPGRVKRSGASCNGSVTSLRKRAKNASGEKAKMYHWCANMKSGKKK